MTDIPTVRLAGRDWPIPELAMKQNRIVVPNLMKIMPAIGRIANATAGDDMAAMIDAMTMSTEDVDLAIDAVYTALTRGSPGLARNEFLELPISLPDLFMALPVVMKQTGIIKTAPAGEAAPVGEAPAAI